MKKAILLILCLVMLTVLAGCACEHEWQAADCENPKTCALCEETEGNRLAHDWAEADCVTPKTCALCGETKGEALGHSWVEANCQLPKHCSVCNEIEGIVIDHSWVEATTEAPKTCSMCDKTEGERIITDERFTTAACKELFGTWTAEYIVDGQAEAEAAGLIIEGEDLNYTAYISFVFENDGTMRLKAEYEPESFLRVTRLVAIYTAYQSMTEQGYSRDEADQAFLSLYGMNVTEYVDSQMESIDPDDYAMDESAVYYVKDGSIYASNDWASEFEPEEYALRDGKLYMAFNEEELAFTREDTAEN